MKAVTSSATVNPRRQFLKRTAQATGAICAGSTSLPAIASALYAPPAVYTPTANVVDRQLRLINDHTWEKIDVVFWADGAYDPDGLHAISHLLRDHRMDKSIPIDVNLIEDMYTLYNMLDTNERMHILSGYRTPTTNNKLRSRSTQVARNSLHMEGRAVDLYVPGKTAKQVREVALSLNSGGVGYYPTSGFVHIDTGIVRAWSGS